MIDHCEYSSVAGKELGALKAFDWNAIGKLPGSRFMSEKTNALSESLTTVTSSTFKGLFDGLRSCTAIRPQPLLSTIAVSSRGLC